MAKYRLYWPGPEDDFDKPSIEEVLEPPHTLQELLQKYNCVSIEELDAFIEQMVEYYNEDDYEIW